MFGKMFIRNCVGKCARILLAKFEWKLGQKFVENFDINVKWIIHNISKVYLGKKTTSIGKYSWQCKHYSSESLHITGLTVRVYWPWK